MRHTYLSIAAIFLAAEIASAENPTQFSANEHSTSTNRNYKSWVGDGIFPQTAKLFDGIDRTARFAPQGYSREIRIIPKNYQPPEAFDEIAAESPAQSVFVATRALFEHESERLFRAAFSPTDWDEQKSQQIEVDSKSSDTIAFEFPQSKKRIVEEEFRQSHFRTLQTWESDRL